MGRTLRHFLFWAAASAGPFVLAGCLNLRPSTRDVVPHPAENPPAARPANLPESDLSGVLDGPTLRLALRDLAVILDTLGRLEQVRPELKTQMLAELAEADAATAAAVVRKWRMKLVELQATSDKVRTAAAESRATSPPTADPRPAAQSPAAAVPQASTPALAPASTRHAGAPKQNQSPAAEPAKPVMGSAAVNTPPSRTSADGQETGTVEPPSWEELLLSLLTQTRERADGVGPQATRARVQTDLLELVWHCEQAAEADFAPDPELWSHLVPAIDHCLGNGLAEDPTPEEVIRSLQVATELLRGPRRFQVRGLAFCTRIRGFGNVERLESNTFSPGQAVLLYSEVEHFLSEPEPGGFRTRLKSFLELADASGGVVWKEEFAAVEDHSTEPRRDYFLSHRFRLPEDLPPGLYGVRLTLRDELTNRTTSGGIALTVRE